MKIFQLVELHVDNEIAVASLVEIDKVTGARYLFGVGGNDTAIYKNIEIMPVTKEMLEHKNTKAGLELLKEYHSYVTGVLEKHNELEQVQNNNMDKLARVYELADKMNKLYIESHQHHNKLTSKTIFGFLWVSKKTPLSIKTKMDLLAKYSNESRDLNHSILSDLADVRNQITDLKKNIKKMEIQITKWNMRSLYANKMLISK